MPCITPGTYRARPVALILAESKAGNPYVQGQFEPVDMPGTVLYWNGNLVSDKQKNITFKTLRLLGFRGDDLTAITYNKEGEVLIVVENEEYNGKQHSRVQWVNSTQGKKVESTLDPAKAAAFAAKMRGAILAFDQKNKTQEEPQDNTNTTADLPF
jgi:hypothetical protein